MGEMRNGYRILVGKLKGQRLLERTRILVELVLKKWYARVWTGFIWPRMETSDGLL
jgi:hypothetical protein